MFVYVKERDRKRKAGKTYVQQSEMENKLQIDENENGIRN